MGTGWAPNRVPAAVLDSVDSAIKKIARRIAERLGVDADDAMQEARILAWRDVEAGLPSDRILEYVARDLPRQLARGRSFGSIPHHLDPSGRVSPRTDVARPLSRQDRIGLAESAVSSTGVHLDRIEHGAPLKCPGCGSAGHWGTWYPGLGRCIDNSAARALALRELLEPGVPTADSLRETRGVDKPHDDEVWICSRCLCWTYEPDTPNTAPSGDWQDGCTVRVNPTPQASSPEDALIEYCGMVASGPRGRARA